ncbi:putative porin [Pelobium manganitolerans]|uniref:putative porin n=1 Tax=Pelobium manganitolerans TaxID=1842495 RepID=UPI001FE2C9E8|nr:putative porin [Pelobium manganitolerans]
MKKYFLILTLCFFASQTFAQLQRRIPQDGEFERQQREGNNSDEEGERGEENIDSLRAKLDSKRDSVVYNATYIKYTKAEFLTDSNRLFLLDTSTNDFHRYRILDLPEHPTMNLGLNGLSYRNLLFEPAKTIGFDVGYHYYDRYLLKPEDIKYYQARTQYTELYFENPAFGRATEQQFHVIHTQNVKPNWNVGASFAKLGSRAYYGAPNRRADALVANHLNASLWSWYQSPNKRYTMLANATFNNLKGYENGSILNDSVFTVSTRVDPEYEAARLNTAKRNNRNNTLYLQQYFNIGKQKSLDSNSTVLPTQRVGYKIAYNTQKYFFQNDGYDASGLLKHYYIYTDSSKTADSTYLKHLNNEFSYSFYLRGKSLSFLRNELKVTAGIAHDYYTYQQYNFDTSFQNITLKGDAEYSFSDKANLNVNIQQIVQGRNFGDFLYQASSEIKLGNRIGSVLLEAYSQNQSPSLVYERQVTNHYLWNLSFNKIKTQNLSFSYLIPKYHFAAKASYYLLNNYLYFSEGTDGDAYPTQVASNINLLKLSLRKDFKFGKFTSENFLVYQKTDFESVLMTPEVYTFHSFYMHQDFFKVLKTEFGFDLRYFSNYNAPSYAPAIGQFYRKDDVKFDTYPVVDVWIRTNWKRANLFLRYDYINEGLFSKGYYTVNRYPMPYRLAKFGVRWNFYD